MTITHLTSLSQLDSILSKSKDKLSVIDFHATWCNPCHAIAPTFEALSRKYTNVNFLKCDVDAVQEVARRYSVSAMPTFVFLRGSTKVDTVKGAHKGTLEDAVRRHASNAGSTSAFTGKGHTLVGASSSTPVVDMGGFAGGFSKIDPQMKVLLYLLAAYAVFWYLK